MIDNCPLCTHDGGEILASNSLLRIIAPEEPEFPGLVRVIWHAHLAELTDLPVEHRSKLMQVVCQVDLASGDSGLKITLAAIAALC